MDTKLVPTTVMELLERNGALKFDDLRKRTARRHSGLSAPMLEEILMVMEIKGLVRVYRIPKGKRRIEIA
jgi:hypothetical protein